VPLVPPQNKFKRKKRSRMPAESMAAQNFDTADRVDPLTVPPLATTRAAHAAASG
jgi:hypothetical protein